MYQNVHHHHHQVHHHLLHQVYQQSAVELHNRGVHVATVAKAVQPDHRQEAPGKPFQGDDDDDEDDGVGDHEIEMVMFNQITAKKPLENHFKVVMVLVIMMLMNMMVMMVMMKAITSKMMMVKDQGIE